MGYNNKDRYGNRHRSDQAHDVGDSSPGDVGDSSGTFHDRARKNNVVIKNGKAQKQDEIDTEMATATDNESDDPSDWDTSESDSSGKNTNQLAGEVVKVTVDRISGSGNAIAEYSGQTIHVEDGTPGETYSVELTPKSGYLLGSPMSSRE